VDESRDRAQAEQLLRGLEDLREQVEANRMAFLFSGLPRHIAVQQRVEGWVDFYERDLLPAFWDVIPPEVRDRAIERIRGLRVKLQTGAPPDDLELNVVVLRETVCTGEVGLVPRAWYQASVLGVPDRLSARLRELALQARENLRAGDRAAFENDLAELQKSLAEADATWRTWRDTGPIMDASPDLVVVKTPPHEQPN
jgi:hypothetical protein